ncbi:hypothetical protein C2E23DRAFT_723895 [Lenzites betulinus]|nr:hypothetical protein C2E23DRAFT_723895 [Lenzites betulinus]
MLRRPDKSKLSSSAGHAEGDPDEELARLSLIAALTLEDVEQVRNRNKGKSRADAPVDDEMIAFELFAAEAAALDTMASDIRFAQSLDKALESDGRLLDDLARAEETCRRDREFAIALSKGQTYRYEPVPVQRPQSASTSALHITNSPATAVAAVPKVIAPASSNRWVLLLLQELTSRPRAESCVICRDVIEGSVIRVPCGHTYDVGCLVDLFRAATVDESLFPPACCRKPFVLQEVRVYLDSNLQKVVDKKTIEFGTKNRVYCHRPTCSTFIGAATASATNMLCPTCYYYTCGHCKAAAHTLTFRCTSSEDAAVVALAEQAGWKRCPGCGHLVELSFGCYHMTCRCRHQFCYLCTATWKTCKCTQWDENRLVAAAEDRVQRQGVQAPARGGNAVDFRQRVAREAERLRDDHDCGHRWKYVTGERRCEGCGHYLRVFLFNCVWCHIWLCARCRNNRWM